MSRPELQVLCPYCGEPTEIHPSGYGIPEQMVEDCTVCCRPIVIDVEWPEGEETPWVTARTEEE